jgi:gliding motility-associated-like protein
MLLKKLFILAFLGFSISLQAQVVFDLPDIVVANGSSPCLPLTVINFANVSGLQTTLEWDSPGLNFDTVTTTNAGTLSYNDSYPNSLPLTWYFQDNPGLNLLDGETVFEICFTATGNPGDVFDVNFIDSPTPPYVAQYEGNNIVESIPTLSGGTITIASPPIIEEASIQNVLCNGESNGSISLDVSSGNPPYFYEWSPNVGSDFSIENLPVGTYSVTVTDSNNTIVIGEYMVSEPEALALTNQQIPDLTCPNPTGEVILIAGGGISPYSYNLADLTSANGIFSDIASGDYNFTVTDINDCMLTGAFTVEELLIPIVELTGDSIPCAEAITLTAVSEGAGAFTWIFNSSQTGQTGDTFAAEENGNYSVVMTNADLCTDTATVNVSLSTTQELNLEATKFSFCMGDTTLLQASGSNDFIWLEEQPEFQGDSIFFSPEMGGTYFFSITGEDEDCLSDTAYATIMVNEPSGFAIPDTCIRKDDEVFLNAFGGTEYLWAENVYGLSDSLIANPSSTPIETTEYSVIIEDVNGCIMVDTVKVEVVSNPLSSIEPINFITPNGDGENDFLEFKNLGKYNRSDLRVFNRSGSEVFSAIGYENDWGGTYNGRKLPSGTYYYILSIEDEQLKSVLTILND